MASAKLRERPRSSTSQRRTKTSACGGSTAIASVSTGEPATSTAVGSGSVVKVTTSGRASSERLSCTPIVPVRVRPPSAGVGSDGSYRNRTVSPAGGGAPPPGRGATGGGRGDPRGGGGGPGRRVVPRGP